MAFIDVKSWTSLFAQGWDCFYSAGEYTVVQTCAAACYSIGLVFVFLYLFFVHSWSSSWIVCILTISVEEIMIAPGYLQGIVKALEVKLKCKKAVNFLCRYYAPFACVRKIV